MEAKDVATISISLAALLIALYGIVERRKTSTRAERIRLGEIVDELNRCALDLATHQLSDSVVEALNTRRELLGQQAKALLKAYRSTITSAEFRVLAFALAGAGYDEDAEDVWNLAVTAGGREGTMQHVYSLRGYAYFLFERTRVDEARELLRQARKVTRLATKARRHHDLHTLMKWAANEIEYGDNKKALELLDEAEGMVADFTPRLARQSIQQGIEELRAKIVASGNSGSSTSVEVSPQ